MHDANSSGAPVGLAGKRILVVEDEALVSMLVEDLLRDVGAAVLGPAPSVEDALRLVEAATADGGISAAVLDINLNGEHVSPVADVLAALGVPFLFATGYGENRDARGHEAAPVVEKPFSTERLVAALAVLASADAARDRKGREQTGRGEKGGEVSALGRAAAVCGAAFPIGVRPPLPRGWRGAADAGPRP